MFKHHKILGFCLILIALFAPTAHAETVVVNPGTVGGEVQDFAFEADTGLLVDILWTDNKTLEWVAGTHVFLLFGPYCTGYAGILLDADGNEIPGTELIGETPCTAGSDISIGLIDLPETTVFSGIRLTISFNTQAAYQWLWDHVDRPVVGEGVAPVPTAVVAASLPSSRSVQVGSLASAFATVINTGNTTATDCSLAPQTSVPADFAYQTTDAANAPVGTPNTPADIPAGGSQNFIFGFAPTAPIDPIEMAMTYDCTNSDPAPVTVGLNTLLLSASAAPVPDIVALALTPTGDGILNLPGTNGSNAFAVSTVNVGSTGTITATPAPSTSLPLVLSICETNPSTGACLSAPASSATSSVSGGATPTYSVFVTGTGTVPFDPATNRITVDFRDAGNVVRGSTSVAVSTTQ